MTLPRFYSTENKFLTRLMNSPTLLYSFFFCSCRFFLRLIDGVTIVINKMKNIPALHIDVSDFIEIGFEQSTLTSTFTHKSSFQRKLIRIFFLDDFPDELSTFMHDKEKRIFFFSSFGFIKAEDIDVFAFNKLKNQQTSTNGFQLFD